MPTDIATLGIKIEAKDIRKAVAELDRLENQSGKTEKSTDKLKGSFVSLRSVLATIGVVALTRELLDQVNTYTALSNKLKLVTTDAQNLTSVQNTLFDVAQDTRASLEGTIDLYSRLARSTESLGISQTELADVTKTINEAIAVSGATSQEASAALFQLGQGLSAGALRGEELNSVMEQTPRLAMAIADGLGVSIAQLRKMGAEGELNAEKVIGAIQNQAGVINSEFGQTEKTISQAMQQISNVALQTFGSIDGGPLVSALDEFRETISDPSIVEGLQTLSTGVINLTTGFVKLSAATAGFATWLGESVARLTLSDQDLENLKEAQRIISNTGGAPRSIVSTSTDNISGIQDQLQTQFDIESQLRIDHQTRLNESLAMLEQQNLDESIDRQLAQMDIEAALAQDRIDLAEAEAQAKKNITVGMLSNLSVLMTAESKRLFNVGKVAAIANAMISGYEAIVHSYKEGAKIGGPPLGAAYAATAALAAGVQIQNIRNQTHGGGGGSISSGGVDTSTTAPTNLPGYAAPESTNQGGGSVQVIIQGNVIGNEDYIYNDLIPSLQEAITGRDILLISEDSRQALELRA